MLLGALLRALLPGCVALRAGAIAAHVGPIWPEEAARVARAADGRRAEFAAGRSLARQALADLGAAPCALPSSPGGAPAWPAGYLGSITHSRDQAAAAVARQTDLRALGIDLESGLRFKPGMERLVLLPAEIAALPTDDGRARAATLRFCAKEAFYKMQYPLTGQRLGFHDAQVDLHPDGSIRLTLLPAVAGWPAGQVFTGHSAAGDAGNVAAFWLD